MLRLSNIITVKAGVSFASCQCSPDRRARNVSSNVESECDFGQFGRNTSANCETWSSVEKEKCSIALTLQCLEWSAGADLHSLCAFAGKAELVAGHCLHFT